MEVQIIVKRGFVVMGGDQVQNILGLTMRRLDPEKTNWSANKYLSFHDFLVLNVRNKLFPETEYQMNCQRPRIVVVRKNMMSKTKLLLCSPRFVHYQKYLSEHEPRGV